MASYDDTSVTSSVDHREDVLASPVPGQINADKVVVRRSSSEVEVAGGRERKRSEVKVEINGIREAALTPTKTVVTSTVRTVLQRSLSGSGSGSRSSGSGGSSSRNSRESSVDAGGYEGGAALPVFDDANVAGGGGGGDSVFLDNAPDGSAAAAVERGGSLTPSMRRTSSDSHHYISHTYLVNSADRGPQRRQVSAVKNVKFTCSRRINLSGGSRGSSQGSNGSLGSSVDEEEEEGLDLRHCGTEVAQVFDFTHSIVVCYY